MAGARVIMMISMLTAKISGCVNKNATAAKNENLEKLSVMSVIRKDSRKT